MNQTGDASATNVGEYKITWSLKDTSNYQWSDGTTTDKSATWNINAANITDDILNFKDNTVTYDGEEHSINVLGGLTGATIEYSTDGTEYSEKLPTFKNAGVYTIWYRATQSNYNAKTGSKKLTINKKPITVKANDKTIDYGDSTPTFDYSITKGSLATGETLKNIKVSQLTQKDTGKYTITVSQTAGSNKNYNITFENGTYTINKKQMKELTIVIENQIYTGEEVEPTIVIKDGDKIIPSSEYTIKFSDNIKPGIATVIIKNEDGGNYIIETTESTFVIIDPGTVELIENETPNAYNAKVVDSSEGILSKIELTEEDVDNIKHGKNIDIYFEVKDISNSISNSDKKAIEKKLGKNTLGLYLDISLFKKVAGEDAKKILETKEPITISFEIPDELINKNSNVERTYKVLRLHDGSVDELDVKVNGKTATFETDKFSIYALTYTDTNKETTSSPKTGDNITMYVIMFIISALGLRTLSVGNKRQSKRIRR